MRSSRCASHRRSKLTQRVAAAGGQKSNHRDLAGLLGACGNGSGEVAANHEAEKLSSMRHLLDLLWRQRFDGWQAQAVEFAQRNLIHHARLVPSLGRVVDGIKNR